MAEQIKVSVELDQSKAENALKRLAQQLNMADMRMEEMRKAGVIWGDSLKSKTDLVREAVEKLGLAASGASDKLIKGNKAFGTALASAESKVVSLSTQLEKLGQNVFSAPKERAFNAFWNKLNDKVQAKEAQDKLRSIKQLYIDLQRTAATKLPVTASLGNLDAMKAQLKMQQQLMREARKTDATAPLRDQNEKSRQAYFAKLQQQYLREQESLRKHNERLAQQEQAALIKYQAQMAARAQARAAYAKLEEDAAKAQLAKYQSQMAARAKAREAYAKLEAEEAKKAQGSTGTPKESLRAKAARELAEGQKRVTMALIGQAGAVNSLKAAWGLAKAEMKESISVANLFQSAARSLTAVVGSLVHEFVQLVKTAPSLASDMLGYRNALQLVTGSQEQASKLLSTAIDIAVELKLSIVAVTREYSKFTNSATIAGLSIQQATKTFKDYSIAARVLNLSQQRTSGMFLALEQMISKGRVSMEELRRQLGEHIPGALNLAAKAMGYGRDELGKFIKEVSSGNVVSIDLVQNLGKLLKDRTLPQLGTALKKFSAAWQNMVNAFDQVKMKLGDYISIVLVPVLDGTAELIRAFAAMLPDTALLGDSVDSLNKSMTETAKVADTAAQTYDKVADNMQQLYDSTKNATMSLDELQQMFSSASTSGMLLFGTVGAAGLGGAFKLMGKSVDIVKAGLKNFAQPFIYAYDKLRPLLVALGTGGLAGVVRAIGSGIMIIVRSVQALAFIATIAVLVNPWTALVAAITAATIAIYAYLDANNELNDLQTSFKKTFQEASKMAADYNDRLEEIIETMAFMGQEELSIKATGLRAANDSLRRQIQYMSDMSEDLDDQLTLWDSIAAGAGYVTEEQRRISDEQFKLNVAIEQAKRLIAANEAELVSMEQATAAVGAQFKAITEHLTSFLANKELRDLQLEVRLIGKDALYSDIERIKAKFANLQAEAMLEAGKNRDLMKSEAIRLDLLMEEEIRLTTLRAGYEETKKALDEFNDNVNSFATSLENTTVKLQQEAMTIGKTGTELEKLNAGFRIAALEEQALAIRAAATNSVMLEKVAVLDMQIATIKELEKSVIALKDAELVRQEKVKIERQETERMIELQKQGHAMLKQTITLEQQFALRVQEVNEALTAVGASAAQREEVLKAEWRKIVDEADNGLKSMETLSEEFAKNMQNNFSDFFFDVMKGDFDNLADSFTEMLQRMVAEAIATNLSKYIMGPGGGSGILDSFFGSKLGSALFNTAPAMPTGNAATSGIVSMGSGFLVNLPGNAYGGDYTVPGTGGTDSQVVAFRATPGENVTVTPPSNKGTMSNSNTGNTIVNFNITAQDVNSFNASRSQIELELRNTLQRAGRNA